MNLFKQRLRWAWRAWPLWVLIIVSVITAHFGTWAPPPVDLRFNKVFGAALQGLGAFLVLISIDGNLGLFRGHGVFIELRDYIRAYPRRVSIVTVVGASCGQANANGLTASVRVWPEDIDGRVAALEQWCKELEIKISNQRAEVLRRVDEVQAEQRATMGEHGRRVENLAKKIEETAVGGTKLQAFGVGLAVIGSILSIYS
jgi:uncharacterized coiled-coil protein SlyX